VSPNTTYLLLQINEHLCQTSEIALYQVCKQQNSEQMSNSNGWIFFTLPLFQLYWFLTSTSPLGLNGPFSENAPTPKEEQPGPAHTTHTTQRFKI
jgi:hypothetical protein